MADSHCPQGAIPPLMGKQTWNNNYTTVNTCPMSNVQAFALFENILVIHTHV